MGEFIQYLILGLGLGATYGLTAQGLVVIHRGSGVVNFANAGFGLIGAYVYYELHNGGVPTVVSVLAGLAAAAIVGVVAHAVIMRRLWTAAQLTRVIATLGMLGLIDGLANIKLGESQIIPPYLLPNHGVEILGRRVSSYDFYLLAIAVVVTVVLQVVYRRTRFGLLTTATAENRRAASALGHSPDLISAANWAVGSALAALAVILIAPILSLSVESVGLLLVPALAAAVVGDFVSFPVTLVGAMLVGIGESMVQWANIGPGWPDAVPFAAVIIILLLKGASMPGRNAVQARLPKVGPGRINWRVAAPGIAIAILLASVVGSGVIGAMIGSAAFGVVLLSSVVVTGYAGQLSLAQLGLAGGGAFIGARVAEALNLGFWPALVIAMVGVLPVGIIVGVPALRTRGVNLAIVTLGIGVVINEVVLANPNYTGGLTGTPVVPPSLFGLSLNAQIHPTRYFILCLAFLVLCALAVANLRRSSVGRYLIAVRGNERAAASLGLNVARLKLYAFAVGSVLAAIGGILFIYQAPFVNWSTGWDVVTAITLVGSVVIFGIGYTSGALLAATVATAGLIPYLVSLLGTSVANWVPAALGFGLIVAVVASPDGAVPAMLSLVNVRVRSLLSGSAAERASERALGVGADGTESRDVTAMTGHRLQLQNIGVSFGGVRALHGVTLSVQSGEILGLIGPNGAGKTTLIDIVTGMTKATNGSIALDGRTLDRLPAAARARCGLARSFQALELFDDMTVLENILVATDRLRWWAYLRSLILPQRAALSSEALAAVRAFGLEQDLGRYPGELPYGRRRLVGIVRAVAGGAGIVLLDEPAAGLDERESEELGQLLRMLVERWGIGVLLIEHDMTLVMKVSDRVAALDFGELLVTGPPAEVRQNPRVMTAYLGVSVDPPKASPAPVGASVAGTTMS